MKELRITISFGCNIQSEFPVCIIPSSSLLRVNWLNRNSPRWLEWWMQMIIANLWHSGNAMGGLLIILIRCSRNSKYYYAFCCDGIWIVAISTRSGCWNRNRIMDGQEFNVNTSINEYLCHLFIHLLLWNQCFPNIILCMHSIIWCWSN